MITLTRLSGDEFWLNPHQIEYIERAHDTSIAMLSGKRVIVRETVPVVIEKIVEYRRLIGAFKNEE
ncbi:MAG: flagellar FlbD family protein [Spirochaetes bacterium]|nr:flagellar FlbD family protein [Spirochaetota bacterium]MBU1081734.1 flagellar FlbD family protein [Spirochaetota bacterium]